MSELGFNVKELIGGLDWWKRDGYPTERVGAGKPPAPKQEKGESCGCI